MKPYLAIFMLLVTHTCIAVELDAHRAQVCLSIDPFAQVNINDAIKLEPVDASETKTAAVYRGKGTITLQANTDVSLWLVAQQLTGHEQAFQPKVSFSKGNETLAVSYGSQPHEIDIELDIKLDPTQVVQTGIYEGVVDVIVMASTEHTSCI